MFGSLFADMAPPEVGAYPVGVTGTQKGRTEAQSETFNALLLTALPQEPTDLIHGGCVGADEECHYDFKGHFPTAMKHVHPGHIEDKRAFFARPQDFDGCTYIYPPRECAARNALIATTVKALFVISRLPYEVLRSGTWQTARMFGGIQRRANRQDRPMYVIWPDGLYRVYRNDFYTEMNQQSAGGPEAREWAVAPQGRHFREDY